MDSDGAVDLEWRVGKKVICLVAQVVHGNLGLCFTCANLKARDVKIDLVHLGQWNNHFLIRHCCHAYASKHAPDKCLACDAAEFQKVLRWAEPS